MAATTSHWMIDTSAFSRLVAEQAADTELWSSRIQRGVVRLLFTTRLEIGIIAKNGRARSRMLSIPPISLMPMDYLTPNIEKRADEVQTLLADKGQHRGPSVHDMLLAAAAEMLGHTVLHADKHFDLIAQVTGQPVQRVELTA